MLIIGTSGEFGVLGAREVITWIRILMGRVRNSLYVWDVDGSGTFWMAGSSSSAV